MLILMAAASLVLAQAAEPAAAAKPAAGATSPAKPGEGATAPAKPAKPPKPKLICTTEADIGSVIPKRVCRTPEQVEAELEHSRGVTDSANDRTVVCTREGC